MAFEQGKTVSWSDIRNLFDRVNAERHRLLSESESDRAASPTQGSLVKAETPATLKSLAAGAISGNTYARIDLANTLTTINSLSNPSKGQVLTVSQLRALADSLTVIERYNPRLTIGTGLYFSAFNFCSSFTSGGGSYCSSFLPGGGSYCNRFLPGGGSYCNSFLPGGGSYCGSFGVCNSFGTGFSSFSTCFFDGTFCLASTFFNGFRSHNGGWQAAYNTGFVAAYHSGFVAGYFSGFTPRRGTYIAARGTYVPARGTYVSARGTYVPSRGSYCSRGVNGRAGNSGFRAAYNSGFRAAYNSGFRAAFFNGFVAGYNSGFVVGRGTYVAARGTYVAARGTRHPAVTGRYITGSYCVTFNFDYNFNSFSTTPRQTYCDSFGYCGSFGTGNNGFNSAFAAGDNGFNSAFAAGNNGFNSAFAAGNNGFNSAWGAGCTGNFCNSHLYGFSGFNTDFCPAEFCTAFNAASFFNRI